MMLPLANETAPLAPLQHANQDPTAGHVIPGPAPYDPKKRLVVLGCIATCMAIVTFLCTPEHMHGYPSISLLATIHTAPTTLPRGVQGSALPRSHTPLHMAGRVPGSVPTAPTARNNLQPHAPVHSLARGPVHSVARGSQAAVSDLITENLRSMPYTVERTPPPSMALWAGLVACVSAVGLFVRFVGSKTETTDAKLAAMAIASRPDLRTIQPHLLQEGDASLADKLESGNGGNPWTDAPWKDIPWTVYRHVPYDLRPFFDAHPGGNWLLNLAIRRDCTGLFESYHLRTEVAAAHIKRLPVLEGFPIEAVADTPAPGDSSIYKRLQNRILKELMDGGGKGTQRSGSMDAAMTTTISFFAAAVLYAMYPGLLTGIIFGATGAWCGMVTQHPGNHGSLSNNEWVNNTLGLMADLVGGSGLCWQYHHNVSHHIHCNDHELDEDVYSAYPALRLDARMPRKWWHKYQHLYMPIVFAFLLPVFFMGDFAAIFGRRTEGAAMHGMTLAQKSLVLALKVVHVALLFGIPAYFHGVGVAAVGCAAYCATWGIVLGFLFAVSHNTIEQKSEEHWSRGEDWAIQQIITSADWGGKLACWMTGGLSLQVVHHLFPAISAYHYPAIRQMIEEECAKDGVPYIYYSTFGGMLGSFFSFMKHVGSAEDVPSAYTSPKASP